MKRKLVFWILLLLIPYTLAEIGLRIVLRQSAETWVATQNGRPAAFHEVDPWLGDHPRPNLNLQMKATRGERTLYDVTYRTDSLGRRLTPILPAPARNRHLILFGCSYVFGTGVNDEETFPAALGRLAPSYRPYNYGGSGYGPQEMLALLQTPRLREQIAERHGIAIYTLIDDHIERALGSPRVFLFWGQHLPYYRLTSDGRLERRGDFSSGRPFLSKFYRAMRKSLLLTTLAGVLYPHFIGENDLDLVVAMIEASGKKFELNFPGDGFYVLFYPGAREFSARIISRLAKRGIRYLDYSHRTLPKEDWLLDDHHPSARGHETVAGWVARDLGLGAESKVSRR